MVSGFSSGMVQAGGNQRFYVHKFWWVQDIPDACRTHSAVLCVVFLLFGHKGTNFLKRINGFAVGGWAAGPQHLSFQGCYVV
jgi:hypothetical protein